jgi:hypothetical protein
MFGQLTKANSEKDLLDVLVQITTIIVNLSNIVTALFSGSASTAVSYTENNVAIGAIATFYVIYAGTCASFLRYHFNYIHGGIITISCMVLLVMITVGSVLGACYEVKDPAIKFMCFMIIFIGVPIVNFLLIVLFEFPFHLIFRGQY